MSSSILGLINALTSTGTDIWGAKMQSNASRDAAALQDKYLREALEYQKQQDALTRAQYLEERNRQWGLEDADRTRLIQRQDARDTRLAPYRAYGANSLASLLTGPAPQFTRRDA